MLCCCTITYDIKRRPSLIGFKACMLRCRQSGWDICEPIFEKREICYNLRNNNTLIVQKAKTTTYGLECASFLGPKNWRELSLTIKESASLKEFKTKIKSERFPSCNCKLCSTYIANLGSYIWTAVNSFLSIVLYLHFIYAVK